MSPPEETETAAEVRPDPPERPDRPWLGALAVLVLVVLGAALRIQAALGDENFDAESSAGMLKSDPGLLFYLTQRVIEAGGTLPDDFRADPLLAHPELTDVPATYTVGQELLIAWLYTRFGDGVPLHVFCVWVMAVCASLTAAGVYGLARELTGSSKWGAFAALLFSLTPASYRTVGFILVREDLSLPLLALHLYLFARAARLRTFGAFLVAGLSLGAAVATWHATTFLVTMEGAVFFAWYLRRGENPFACRAALVVPLTFAAFALAVPALSAKNALVSLPMQLAVALLVAEAYAAHGGRLGGRALALAALAVSLAFTALVSGLAGGEASDFGHVFELIRAKLAHGGVLPSDPAALHPDSRLLWQGPFATLGLAELWSTFKVALLLALPVLACEVRTWLRGGERQAEALLAGYTALGLLFTWLIRRVLVLPAILLPVLAALFLHEVARWIDATHGARRRQGRRIAFAGLVGTLLVWQAATLSTRLSAPLGWYLPAVRQAEIAALVEAVRTHVPEGEAVACDFMGSTAILAHTRRPIILQPKWETRESRMRVSQFLDAFFHGSASELHRLLRDRYECRFLVVDRSTLLAARYAAGLRRDEPPRPGTAAAAFLSQDSSFLAGIPGFELVWRSPEEFKQSNGQNSDFYRLFRLAD